ncbi:MAG TPA: DUF5667 domain-containing protein [Candidatus Dormibacteraeota bacterium]|jgi:hypothetical protein
MLSHATAQDWLIPYADGMLSNEERQRIDGHVASCPGCREELKSVRLLNLLLVSLPPAPPVAFAPFWLRLQAALPAARVPKEKARFRLYRRAGLAFAAAAFATLTAVSCAFAAESSLPDSPLYPLKHAEEAARLALTPAPQRGRVQLSIASERLREAQVMASSGKPALAVKSVRAFRLMLPSIVAGLKQESDARVAKDEVHALDVELTGVQEANATRGDDDAELKQLVLSSKDELDSSREVGQPLIVPTVPTASPSATPSVTPRSTPRPTPRPTKRPDPKPSDD